MPRGGQAKVLTKDEFNRLLKVTAAGGFGKRNVAMVYMSFALGLRAKEIAGLAIADVLTPEEELVSVIKLWVTKGNKRRQAFLEHPKVRQALLDYLVVRKTQHSYHPEAPLFLSQKGGAFLRQTLCQLFRKLYQQAGIYGASSHSGRRTFITNLDNKGISLKNLQVLAGHASIAMTAKYVETNPDKLRKIASEALF